MDYKKLGFKCGIEIHQQLDSSKLFCECPSELRQDKPDIIVRRKQYAAAGETGEIDVAAAFEAAKGKEFIYEAYSDSNCLVELDEEPPHALNEETLKIALQIALLLNAKPLTVTQVMRKTVIDGSNTSGFQRTLLVARDGWVKTASGKIRIATICLEEDAARIIKKDKRSVTFRLDRLGIPLIEIATTPDIKDPEQAKEVALAIGEILRATKIKRGIGTIRQDVNVSIVRGARSEIKGVQEPALITKTIEREVSRQSELIKQGKKVEPSVRKANPDASTAFLRPLPGAARMYPETDLPLVKLNRKLIIELKRGLPKVKTRADILAELKKKGLHEELAKIVLSESKLAQFDKLVREKISPTLATKILCLYPKEIASHEKMPAEEVKKKIDKALPEIIQALKQKKISETEVKKIMTDLVKGKKIELKKLKKEKISEKEIEKTIKQLIKEKPGLSTKAYMGLLMQKYKDRIEGKKLFEILKKLLIL